VNAHHVRHGLTIILLGLSVILSILLVWNYWQIQLWQHDSAYYDYPSLFLKIGFEGRWLTPYISLLFLPFDGRLIVLLNLACLFGFFFLVSQRYTNSPGYAAIFASLCIQISPASYLLLWPVVTAAATLILFAAALLANRMRLLPFYGLFGVLFFATASNFYYLLPLIHLPLLRKANTFESLKLVWLKVIPCWAFGFVFGYLVMLSVVYFYTGHFGLEVMTWRNPNQAESVSELIVNAKKSFGFLDVHLRYFFDSAWTIAIVVIGLSGLIINRDQRFISMLSISSSMILVHYIVTIPMGIDIAVRTMFSTWIGILVLVFLSPTLRHTRHTFFAILLLCLTLVFYAENRKNLKWYAAVSNKFHEDLVSVLPTSLEAYKGVLFLSDNHTVYKSNLVILYKLGLPRGKIPWLNTDTRWATSAYKAGFKTVVLCGTRDRDQKICHDLRQLRKSIQKIPRKGPLRNTLNIVEGSFDDYIVVRLAPENYPLAPGWKPGPP